MKNLSTHCCTRLVPSAKYVLHRCQSASYAGVMCSKLATYNIMYNRRSMEISFATPSSFIAADHIPPLQHTSSARLQLQMRMWQFYSRGGGGGEW